MSIYLLVPTGGAVKRKGHAPHTPRLKNEVIMAYVIEKLHLSWSPGQIASRISHDRAGESISNKAIQFVYAKATLKHMDLRPCLFHKHRRRLERGHSRKHKNLHILDRLHMATVFLVEFSALSYIAARPLSCCSTNVCFYSHITPSLYL
jgi:hypothetical protein